MPPHMLVLAPAIPSVTIRRLDERTLAITTEAGYPRFPPSVFSLPTDSC